MSWFEKLIPASIKTTGARKRSVPEGLWTKCPECDAVLYRAELERNMEVCTKCGHHMRITARQRLERFFDPESIAPVAEGVEPVDVLKFRDRKRYKERLQEATRQSGENEALLVQSGSVEGLPVIACAFEFDFMAGSMGAVVGERFCRAVDTAVGEHRALVCFASSGGARMQESLFALMQMAKTSAAVTKLRRAGLPYVSVLTDPTMGGVSASLAMLGDVIIAEPRALIGFAGPRVIQQTVGEVLPEGFQRAEFLLQHGAVDMVVPRTELRSTVVRILDLLLHTRRAG